MTLSRIRTGDLRAVALLLCLAAVTGCGRPTGKAVHVYVGLDTSGSVQGGYLGPFRLLTSELSGRLRAGADHLTLYRVDDRTTEFSDTPVPAGSAGLDATLVRETQSPAAAPGTFPAKFWAEVAARAAKDPEPTVVMFCTDGDNDDERASSEAAIVRAAAQLAADGNVAAVAVYGVDPANFAALRRSLAPLGDRLLLFSRTQMDLAPLTARIEAARN